MAGRCAASVRPSGPSSSSDWRAFFSKPPALRCGSVTMTGADLLPASVLKRKAVVYVRQSTPAQVQFNRESQRQQYELVEVARRRGFDAVEIIDDDLGKSASGMVARPGFERLVASLCAGHVVRPLISSNTDMRKGPRQAPFACVVIRSAVRCGP